jgi:hypothetical protein
MTNPIVGATLLVGAGIAQNISAVASGIIALILTAYLLLSAKKRDNSIRKEIKRAEKQIIKVILEGDRRKQPRS